MIPVKWSIIGIFVVSLYLIGRGSLVILNKYVDHRIDIEVRERRLREVELIYTLCPTGSGKYSADGGLQCGTKEEPVKML